MRDGRANHEAQAVARNLLGDEPQPIDYTAMPFAVFASPEVAGVGAREQELKEADQEYATRAYQYDQTARGSAMKADSFVKVIIDLEGEILGCHIIGLEASNLIQEGHDNLGRIVNSLETAKEFTENDDDEVALIFDGAGTEWIPELEDEENNQHELYQAIRDDASACDYCAGAFGVDDAVNDSGVVRLDDNDGHPSIRSLVNDGYEVITY